MEAKKNFEIRHTKAKERLFIVSKGKVYKYGLIKCANEIAERLDVSPQTVINYLSGRCKDGFLVEAISKEFKTLHINSN